MGIGSLPGQPGITAVPDPRLGPEMDRLLANMGRTFQTIPVYETAVIQHVQPDGLGRPAYAITDKGYRLDLSLGTPIREAEEWVIRGEGGPAGRRWQALYRSNSHGDLLGPIAGRFIPPPIIPSALYGGIVSAEQGSSTADPSGASLASITVYPRSVSISGNYDVYNQHFPILHWRSRIWGTDDWSRVNSLNFHPVSPVYLTLTTPILADALTWVVTPDPDANAEIEFNHLLFWRIDGEAVVGSYDGTHLTIFQRGVDGTDPAPHSAAARIELLSLRVPLTDFAQNTHYELQFSFGGSFAEVGVWSDSIDLVTFAISQHPAPPTGLIVDLNNDEFELRWTPPPDASVKQFHIYRYDSLTAPAPGSYTPPAGATDLGIIAGHTITIGANGVHTGVGHTFGVASRNNAGLESTIVWNNDAWVPVSPASFLVEPIAGGVRVTVTDQTAFNRSGFRRYNLWQTLTDPAVAREADALPVPNQPVYNFGDRTAVQSFAIPKYGRPYAYQVTAENWLGQRSALTTGAAWHYSPSLGPSEGQPVNGNFQLPNPDGSKPLYWSLDVYQQNLNAGVVTHNPPGATLTYMNSGGTEGNWCVRAHSNGGFAGSNLIFVLTSQVIIPYNGAKSYFCSCYVKASRGSKYIGGGDGIYFFVVFRYSLWADLDGIMTPGYPVPMDVNRDLRVSGPDVKGQIDPILNQWQKAGNVELYNANVVGTTVYGQFSLELHVLDADGGNASGFDYYFDDVEAVPDRPINPSGIVVTPGVITL